MKNKYLLTLIPILLLTGCTAPNHSIEESDSESTSEETVTPHDWVDERDYKYTNLLDYPLADGSEVHNIDELQAVCDYHAFYKHEKFSVPIADDYAWNVPNYHKIENELNYLYWHEELINGVLGMDAVENGDNWDFTYTIYHNAYKDSTAFFTAGKDIVYTVPQSDDRNETYNDFATEDINKKVIDVSTTQQLWYAAEKGYRINALPGSAAEIYYNKCKELLRNINQSNSTAEQKLVNIYDYISHNSTYDYRAAYMAEDVPNPDLYPDEYCSGDKCFFIEGFFDNNLLVCDGFAKLYTLLGRMEGIEIVRATGTANNAYQSRSEAGHAYCYFKLTDTWYLSDITWGQSTGTVGGKYCSFNSHRYMATTYDAMAPYLPTDVDPNTIYNGTDNKQVYITENYFKDKSIMMDSLYVTSVNQLNRILSTLDMQEKLSYVNFYLASGVNGYATFNSYKNIGKITLSNKHDSGGLEYIAIKTN